MSSLRQFTVSLLLGTLILVSLVWDAYSQPALARNQYDCFQGKMYSARTNSQISPEDLLVRIRGGIKVVYIGERHGVEAHPLAAACLMSYLANQDIALVAEQFRKDQQPVIAAYRQDHPETVVGLGSKLQWWKTGWPAWKLYDPLFSVAWLSRSPLLAGDRASDDKLIDTANLKAVYGTRLADVTTDWARSMQKAHCNLISQKRAAEMARFQMSRDMSMAHAVIKAEKLKVRVLFYGGRAHVRHDRSVPFVAEQLSGGSLTRKNTLSIALVEEARSDFSASQYDIIWRVGKAKKKSICSQISKFGNFKNK